MARPRRGSGSPSTPVHRCIPGVYLSRYQNILVAQAFLRSLVERYGEHEVYSDRGAWYPDWCRQRGLEHRLLSPYEKSPVERVNEYLKDVSSRSTTPDPASRIGRGATSGTSGTGSTASRTCAV
ncbi:MAG: hypothetical protein ABSF83_14755 [Nitrososphaerales archaeon]